MKRARDRISPKTITLEMVIENPIFGSLAEMRNMNSGTFWKIRPPPKWKKTSSPAQQLGRGVRGSIHDSRSFAPTEKLVVNLDRLASYGSR
jgi:hypothetical protein